VANFVSLIESGFYDGLTFHRVLEDFMAQTGDPKGDGSGGPGYTIACECYSPEARRHFTGSLSMAKSMARDSGGSQFFLTFKRTDFLDGKHTVFGRVLSGWDVLDSLTRTQASQPDGREIPIPDVEKDKITKAEIIRKRDHEYKPKKVGEPDQAPEGQQPPVEPAKSDDGNPPSDDASKSSDQAKSAGDGNQAPAKPDAEQAPEAGNPEQAAAPDENNGGGEPEPKASTTEEPEKGGGIADLDDNHD
jgi:cyclophilin family peptidyl-prolyl cis-trans isomerase